MNRKEDINKWILGGAKYSLQNVSIDNVIFGYHEKELKVLLQKPQLMSKWLLPGGYIRRNETIDEAAERIAKSRTGLDKLYLRQFKAFGKPDRTKDPDFTQKIMREQTGLDIKEDHWMFDYFVSLGYYTLTEFSKVRPSGEYYMEECEWWNLRGLPALLYDHKDIIDEALKALRLHLYHFPIGIRLLPKKFTLPEIQVLYETLSGKSMDSRNFSKKLIASGIINKLDEKRNIGPHRSPFLYSFDKTNYIKGLEDGIFLSL